MSETIKAKVLEYRDMYHSIFCGRAKVELLEGQDTGEIFEIPVVYRYGVGSVIELHASEGDEN